MSAGATSVPSAADAGRAARVGRRGRKASPRRLTCPGRSAAGPRVGATRRFGLALGLIVLAGLAVRIDFVRNVAPPVPALGDAHAYHVLADNLAHGRGYIRPYDFERLGRTHPDRRVPAGLSRRARGSVVGRTADRWSNSGSSCASWGASRCC